ncbi:RTX iron-regulated FrpC family protein [Nonlabens ponticola]|uniref:Lipocalin-like domain-containing protein n=1 Tax=Nonlabens ponticola TaxID=2496866 RepID=A0A3S9MYT8_9FLAO|nr:RTX iron-regulated FrpC family protein [Nonlabens ponticola]AZQ44294.1 hypothetical protein EJ995_08620 [Nonlabens ponticola]
MKKVGLFILFVSSVLIISCDDKNKRDKADQEFIEVQDVENSTKKENKERYEEKIGRLEDQLQGTWTRIDYPYSTFIFKENSAKLISEGLAEEPEFKTYTLSYSCNGKTNAQGYSYLWYEDTQYCETIKVQNDTLIQSNPDFDYLIKYIQKQNINELE